MFWNVVTSQSSKLKQQNSLDRIKILDISLFGNLYLSLTDWQEEDNATFLSTLTRTQAAAVERRVKSLQQTLRRRNRQHVPDVRDIFRPPEQVRRRTTDRGRQSQGGDENSSLLKFLFLSEIYKRFTAPSNPSSQQEAVLNQDVCTVTHTQFVH